MIYNISKYEIDISVEEDIEGDDNRGWRVDKVSAVHDGNEIGYLKMAYITKERFADHYPTIFNWLDQIKGHIIIPRPLNHEDPEWSTAQKRHYMEFNVEEIRRFISSIRQLSYSRQVNENLSNCDLETLQALATVAEVEAIKQFGGEFKKFRQQYVNKPVDDFVRVESQYQRHGIAETMYRVAVKYLNERGMHLYLSTLRQPAATALADKFRAAGAIRKMSNGRERFIPENTKI